MTETPAERTARLALDLGRADRELRELRDLIATGEASDGHHTHNELYDYRMLYNAHAVRGWLAMGLPVVKARNHSDGEPCFGGGWFIVVATLPTGQVSNHYRDEYWDLFAVPEVDLPPEYDGHSPAIAADRLRDALSHADCDLPSIEEEYAGILQRQGELLTGIANALKGPPPELTTWSHHDLPELAAAVVADARRQTFAEVSRALNLVADIWERDGSDPCRVRITREYANAYRLYAEGLGEPTGFRHAEPDPRNPDTLPLAAASAKDQEGT